ncbi:hypothetical protein XarjCFBP7645_13225 [Xanthomonas arboricola]|uniref:Uncharacterized protein n=1 Tax=Xanthomonas arboricola TaxID=56448 RepID=A0A2S7AFD0_9XANT|nr:hypothetical protein XarjCFBP7645_13225 [Xanthomonas arboricola]
MAPALLAFDRSTAGSNGTDSAVPAIENLPQPSALPAPHQADAAGRQNGVAHSDVPVRACRHTCLMTTRPALPGGCYSFSTSSPASRGASAGWNFSRSSASSRTATCGLSRR